MDPELRGQLEVVADEILDDLVALARVESDVAPVSAEYVLGMLEVVLVGALDESVTEEELRKMEEDEEELLGEVRKIVRRREDDIRKALNRDDRSSTGDTQIFDP